MVVMVWAFSLCLLEAKQSPSDVLRTGGIYHAPRSRDNPRSQGGPCKVEECGPCPEGSITFTPNPPEVDKDLYVNISLIAPTDIWYLTARGNVTMGDSFVRRFDENLCDVKADICPINKGEKLEYQDHFLLSSILIRRTTYSGYVELINQDDVHIGCYFVKDCLFV